MSDEVKLSQGLEVLGTLLHRSAADFLDASIVGDYDLSLRYLTNAVTIMGRLEPIIGRAKAGRIWASAWKGIIPQ
jgi:hypothetical protein